MAAFDRRLALIVRQYHHFGADTDAAVQIDDVRVLQPDTAARDVLADGGRVVGAVDAIIGVAKIKRAGT